MKALTSKFKKKFPDIELSRRHIGRIIRYNDKTRKRTRHFHYTYNNQEYRKLTKGVSTLHRKPKIYKRDN